MNILFLSFYYEPDLSAGSFRNTALVEALVPQLPKGSRVDVITTLPNRYAGFSAEAPAVEETEGVRVRRVSLPAHQSGMVDQSKAFMTFASQARKLAKHENYDLVYASSSRLMTAVLGAYMAKRKQVPLYLDIRDIFVDTIKDVLPSKVAFVMKPLFSMVEHWAVAKANRVNVVSAGFKPYFQARYDDLNLALFTNGIDDEFLRVQPKGDVKSDSQEGEPATILYAGNIGEGQGLHHIIPALADRLKGRAKIKIIGGGGRLTKLTQAMASSEGEVELCKPLPRAELIEQYQQADVLFLHLNDYDAFKKVLPSKLFEYGAMGKPILAGVGGYAAEFVSENIDNAALFAPCDVDGAVRAFESLKLETRPRVKFVAKFARVNIMRDMAADVIATLEHR